MSEESLWTFILSFTAFLLGRSVFVFGKGLGREMEFEMRVENKKELFELGELNDKAKKYLEEICRLHAEPDIVGFKVQFDLDVFIKEHEIKIKETWLFVFRSEVINNKEQSDFIDINTINQALVGKRMIETAKQQIAVLHSHLCGWKMQIVALSDACSILAEMLDLVTKNNFEKG